MTASPIFRSAVVAAILVVSGIARMPMEHALTEELRDQGMLSKPLDIGTRKKLGQGFWAVSLGGLRTLVATILNLRAFSYFEDYKWDQLADTYETVVQLSPHSTYYWDTASWHLAYNAASYQQIHSTLPDLRRRSDWRNWIQRGTAILEEGVRQNPDDWKLWSKLGFFYADPNKLVDYEKAAHAYHQSVATGNSMPKERRLEAYALARIPERTDEALDLIHQLRAESIGETPTFRSLRFALALKTNPQLDPKVLAQEIFGSDERAYRHLYDYYYDPRSEFPMNGVPRELRRLERELQIPEESSVFKMRKNIEQNPPNPWKR